MTPCLSTLLSVSLSLSLYGGLTVCGCGNLVSSRCGNYVHAPPTPLTPHSTDSSPDAEDIVEEAIALFRANCFFRNYEIQGPGDRVLIYLILFISECLAKVCRSPVQLGGCVRSTGDI